jgi:hypothetical protein
VGRTVKLKNHGSSPSNVPTGKPPSDAPPPKADECSDCHKKFTDRLETRWDVHMHDGTYIVVCSPCFQKRDSARAPVDDDEPPQGTTSVLKAPKKKSKKK